MEPTIVQTKLVLTGARAGLTCTLLKRQFINGVHVVEGDITHIAGLIKLMGRSYKAFPEGSAELAHYQALDKKEAANGKRDLPESAKRDIDEPVRVDIRPEPAPAPDEVPAGPDGAAGAETGDLRVVPDGDGQPDSGDDQLGEALKKLDPENDEHWTQEGKPAVAAVTSLIEGEEVFITRADIDKAAPEMIRPE